MSQKGRLRRIEGHVCWLETEGRYRRVTNLIKIHEMAQIFTDRVAADPALAAKVKEDTPFFFAYMSRASAGMRPAAAPSLPPVVVPLRPPPPEPQVAPRVEPILRDAAVPAAPQDEVRAAPPPPAPLPAVMPGQPMALPPPDMQIRPVHWRPRGAEDYYDEEDVPGTNGHCITDYDPLRDEYDDDG